MRQLLHQRKALLAAVKSKIPFNFELPEARRENEKVNFNAGQTIGNQVKCSQPIKIFRMKREGIAKHKLKPKERVYQTPEDTESVTQKLYKKEFDDIIHKNESTKRFYEYEMRRGEDLIDNIPIDPYYEYKIEDARRFAEDRRQQFESMSGVFKEEVRANASSLRQLIDGFENSKHRYEMEEFKKYLAKYPGGLKGPHPDDDPQAFFQYAQKQMPMFVSAKLQMENQHHNEQQTKNSQTSGYAPSQAFISDFISNDRPVLDEPNENGVYNLDKQFSNELEGHSKILTYHSQIPVLPQIDFEQYHSYIAKWQHWWEFTYSYHIANMKNEELSLVRELNLATQQFLRQKGFKSKGSLWFQMEPRIWSLYIYYRTLPKKLRQLDAVRTVYLGLEFYQPDWSYEEKEQALNEAARLSLPLDKVSNRLMTDVLSKRKEYLTPFLAKKLETISPQFTWDIHEFLEEVKQEKLRNTSTLKEKQQSYPTPPDPLKQTEEHLANLPIDFWDNEDGFWDDYIEEKLNRYYKVQPLSLQPRKHLIH